MTAGERAWALSAALTIEGRSRTAVASQIAVTIEAAEQEATAPLRARIAELEAKLRAIEALLDRWAEEG